MVRLKGSGVAGKWVYLPPRERKTSEYGPNDIPLTLPNGLFQRRFGALMQHWRVIGENPASSYDAGFQSGLELGSRGFDIVPRRLQP